jgi:hypothetical protein
MNTGGCDRAGVEGGRIDLLCKILATKYIYGNTLHGSINKNLIRGFKLLNSIHKQWQVLTQDLGLLTFYKNTQQPTDDEKLSTSTCSQNSKSWKSPTCAFHVTLFVKGF